MQVAQDLAATGTGASSGCACGCASGTSFSQSQPSLRQECTVPILVRFSTMNGAPHLGQGSAMGMWGEVKSQSGYREQPYKTRGRPRPPLPALPRRTNSPWLHFGHLMPMVIGRVYLHFG